MYYLSRTCLKWNDEEFWDSSPRFLFKQLDIFAKHNKPPKNRRNGDKEEKITKETKRYKVLDSIGEV